MKDSLRISGTAHNGQPKYYKKESVIILENKKIALLIDAENIAANYIEGILSEITEYGTATYKRMYGDFTNPSLGKWNEKAVKHSIVQIQQPRYSKAKNAADIMLVIDAMDILYAGKVEGFCIVSSDSDFTRLVNRLCEDGMEVIGMGNNNASASLKSACTEFKNVEILLDKDNEEEESTTPVIKPILLMTPVQEHDTSTSPTITDEETEEDTTDSDISLDTVKKSMKAIISRKAAIGKTTGLGEIGSQLVKMYSDFDVRNYGYKSLTTFLDDMEEFEVVKSGNSGTVNLIESKVSKQEIGTYIEQLVQKSPMDLGRVGQKIHEKFNDFTVQDYGYTKFERFINSIPTLEVSSNKKNELQKNVALKKY